MNFTKKILGVGLVAASFLVIAPARAANWVYIGSNKGFDYYVDVDREVVRGSYWSAPLTAVGSDRTRYVGTATVNCNNYTTKIQFGNQVNNWRRINRSSPMDFVGKRVCR